MSPAEITPRIPTLHYLTIPLYDTTLKHCKGSECWRIIRSNAINGEVRLEKLSQHDGEEVHKRLWDMDRKSLLDFDIDAFLQQTGSSSNA